MISKAKSRYIKELQVKKYRFAEQYFLVQGAKAVKETLTSNLQVQTLVGTPEFFASCATTLTRNVKEILEVSEKELTTLGSVEANNAALAVVRMKPVKKPVLDVNEYALVLDDIRDPGNLGTILRTADWYGITTIIASPETTDVYSPKVINATMGSFLRVSVYYTALDEFLATSGRPVYGTFLNGENVHAVAFQKGGLIVIGNESRGISEGIEKYVSHRITIPRLGKAESLNASTAAAIVLDNLSRRS